MSEEPNKKKGPPEIPPKKPKLTKAERRALQEKQRAEKAARQQGGGKQQQQGQKKQQQPQQQAQDPSKGGGGKEAGKQVAAKGKSAQPVPSESSNTSSTTNDKTIDLFSHLPQFRELPDLNAEEFTSTLHPAVIELGMKFATGEIRGGNGRCRAMMQVFSEVVGDYFPPDDVDYRTHLDHAVLKPSFTFWTTRCRPHSVSMGNAFTFLKAAVASMDRDLSLPEAKETLQETIEQYLLERLDYAARAIAQHALIKIEDGDILLTFGNPEVVEVMLTLAKEQGIDFYVWVVDSHPLCDGRELIESLRKNDIPCGYIELNGLTYVMEQVTKVFLGASALMSNGSIYGPVGTACVALLALDKHIPVLACCESYKISNKVQLESITRNELGNPDDLIRGDSLKNWRDVPNLKLLNLLYDVTPPGFVTGVVTEVGIIPPTSVAVLLREMNPQDAAF